MKKKYFEKIVVFIELFFLWEVGSLLISKACFPTPLVALKSLVELVISGKILPHMIDSGKRILLGIFWGLLFSLPVGLLLGYSARINKWFGGLFDFLYTIPKVVFLPIIIVLMGIGDIPKIFLISLVLFFQQAVVIRDAAKSISPELTRSIRIWGANGWQIMRHLVIPGCLPELMTSLRMSLGTAIALLFITENFATVTGLGYFITNCMDQRNYGDMYAGIIILAVLGLFFYYLIDILEKTFCYWKFLEQKETTTLDA